MLRNKNANARHLVSCVSSYPIGRRTQSDWTADGIRSDGGRNLIGRRTESDRAADGIRSDGGRCFKGVHLSQVHQPRNIDVALAWLA